jgi:hypothetical protein
MLFPCLFGTAKFLPHRVNFSATDSGFQLRLPVSVFIRATEIFCTGHPGRPAPRQNGGAGIGILLATLDV